MRLTPRLSCPFFQNLVLSDVFKPCIISLLSFFLILVHVIIKGLAMRWFSVASLFAKQFHVFDLLRSNQTVGVCQSSSAASEVNLFSDPHQGENTGEPEGADACSHCLV